MTAYTKTKINRLFEEKIIKNKDGEVKTHVIVKREYPIPADPRFRKSCARCSLPMMVSDGQHAKFHAHCRRDGRNAIQRTK